MIFNPVYGGASAPNLGSKTITANGTYLASSDNLDGYDEVIANVLNTYVASDEGKVVSDGTLVAQTSTNISANGTYDITTNNSAVVNVPNSYSASDEGKVVDNGGLVSQTSATYTANDTYDTTLIDSVTVNVSGGVAADFPNSLFVMTSSQTLNVKDGMVVGPFNSQAVYVRPLDTSGNLLKPDWRLPWEIKLRARYTQTLGNSMVLCGGQQGFWRTPSIEFGPNGTGIFMALTTNGSSWTHSLWFATSDIPLSANTWYDISMVYDGSKMVGTITDGTNTATQEIAVDSAPYYNSSYNIEIGGISVSSNHYARYVQMDFAKCYIKSQNAFVWGGIGSSTTLITKTITENGTYDASDDNADGYSEVTVEVPPIYECNPSLVRNWDFTNPVNTQGASSYSGSRKAINGWYLTSGSCALNANGIYLTTNNMWNAFALSKVTTTALVGKSFTLSAIINDQLYTASATLTSGTGGKISVTNGSSSVNFNIDSNTQMAVWMYGGGDLIRAIKLEVGSAQTLAHQENGAWVLNKHQDQDEEKILSGYTTSQW